MRFNFVKQSLIGASIITTLAHLVGAFIGYFREAATASYFGTSVLLDVFVLAFTLPEVITSIIFSSIPTALIPALNKVNPDNSEDDSRLFWGGLIYFAIPLVLISIIIYLLRGYILSGFDSNLSADYIVLGKRLIAISSFYIFFRGMEYYFRSWLYKKKHFIVPVLSNVAISVVVIITLFIMYNKFNIESLAYGWLFGSIVLFICNGWAALKVVKPHMRITIYDPWFRLIFKSIVFISIIETISMVYPVIDRYLATQYLEPGYISALRYAMVIIVLPNRIFAIAFSTASFPWISDLSQNGDMIKLKSMYQDSVRMLFFIMGLVVIGVAVYADQIVQLALQRGAFDENSLQITAGPLRIYALGIAFNAVYIYQMRLYYARMEYKRLGLIKLIMLVVKIILSIILVLDLKQNGLALATSLAWFVGFLIMSIDLNRRIGFSIKNLIFVDSYKIPLVLLATVLFFISADKIWAVGNLQMEIFLKLVVLGVTGSALYFGLAYMLKIPEPKKLVEILAKRLRNQRA